jgi:hypothetical protein
MPFFKKGFLKKSENMELNKVCLMCDRIILFIPNNRILYAPLLENVNCWNYHFRYCRNHRMVQKETK